jgi:NADH:ubiquinone oxidoreductase subunit 3 (subunit A)
LSFLKSLYAFSIALLVLAFVVFGVSAFPAPVPPDVPPPELSPMGQDPAEDPAQGQQQQQAFQEQLSFYSQVVSFVVLGVAVALLAGSILWLRSLPIIGEGVTLGAVFTLLYGLYIAISGGAGLGTFVAVTVGLLILLGLVYWRFVRSKDESGVIATRGQQPPAEQAHSPGPNT